MGFCLFGCGGGSQTVQTNNQTTNVGVSVNPVFQFGPEFLQPLANSLGQMNEGLIQRFEPLAQGIQGSIQNANRLAGDLRRTADFSVNPGIAPAPQGPNYVLLGGVLLLGVLVAKL